MNVDGQAFRAISVDQDGWGVLIIDQTRLPHEFILHRLESLEEVTFAISEMQVRGAPLVGATAAYGIALAMRTDCSDKMLTKAYELLLATRPTAVNLCWALDEMMASLSHIDLSKRENVAYKRAAVICEEDVEICSSIGNHGFNIIEELSKGKNLLRQMIKALTY